MMGEIFCRLTSGFDAYFFGFRGGRCCDEGGQEGDCGDGEELHDFEIGKLGIGILCCIFFFG